LWQPGILFEAAFGMMGYILISNKGGKVEVWIIKEKEIREMIKTRDDISKLTVTRMAIYYSALKKMLDDGETMCLSIQIGQHTGISPSIIRKDLSCFGEFGTKGVGYRIEFLLQWIGEILGYNTIWNTVVVGMGMPLLSINCYQNFLPPGSGSLQF
jgi:redox-sensing transcriptional repressor